jgi:endonuclease YncB( thermonuclease family)
MNEQLKLIVCAKALPAPRYARDATTERRGVGKVLAGGKDANLEQVTRGMAWRYKAYEHEQRPNDRKLYAAAEYEAKAARRGLWADADPMAPWDFRHQGK